LGVNHLPVTFGERLTEKAPVFRKDLRIPPVAEALEECGGSLDVGEEEGDSPRGQAGHTRGLRTLSDWATYTRGGSAVLAPAPRG
jgi:hypothetical protein